MRVRFQRKQITAAEREEDLGRGLRSSRADNLFVDDEAFNVETTDVRRLSRYHWEDLLPKREKDFLEKMQAKKKEGSAIKAEVECELPPWTKMMMEMYPKNY